MDKQTYKEMSNVILDSETQNSIRNAYKALSYEDKIIVAYDANQWRWNNLLSDLKPESWDEKDAFREKFPYCEFIINLEKEFVSPYDSTKYHLTKHCGMTDDIFEVYWKTDFRNPNSNNYKKPFNR